MSRRHHLICLAAGAGLLLWVLVAGSGGLALAGLSLALLVCPLVMGGVMWLLMRQPHRPQRTAGTPTDERASAGH